MRGSLRFIEKPLDSTRVAAAVTAAASIEVDARRTWRLEDRPIDRSMDRCLQVKRMIEKERASDRRPIARDALR